MARKNKKKTAKFKISKKDIENAKRKTEIAIKNAKVKLIRAEREIKNYVEKNPKKAAAIATGIGIAIGAVVASAMKKKR